MTQIKDSNKFKLKFSYWRLQITFEPQWLYWACVKRVEVFEPVDLSKPEQNDCQESADESV